MASKTRLQLENWTKTIDVNETMVLDIGGAQNPIKKRTKTWNVKRYDILDLKNPHHFNAVPDLVGDIQKIDWGDVHFKGLEYDVAFCLEVSEYWFDPNAALKNINRFLKKGGILYISFHFVYPVHPIVGEDCLRYTRNGVSKILERAGFKILQLVPRLAENVNLNEVYSLEGMRGQKGFNHNEIGYLVKCQKQ